MKGFIDNIEKNTLGNDNFRKVLYTGHHLQLVLMSLNVGEDIGEEVHHDNDQFFRFESGNGKVIVDENEYSVTGGDVIIIPAGSKHNITNTDKNLKLKMYTIYAPPHHQDGVICATKAEAETNSPDFDGKVSE